MKGAELAQRALPVGGDWRGKRVGVLGLGRSGVAAVELLLARGAQVVAFDDRPAGEIPVGTWGTSVTLRQGEEIRPAADVLGLDALVLSPGVPPDHLLLGAALARGLEVLGELELASRVIAGPIVAVTGTNGKSTTTTLVHRCLEAAGLAARAAGNIGTAVSAVAQDLSADTIAVLEVSSFQLERIDVFHPQVAVVLNVAPDHLDRYDGLEAYAAAKRNILRNLLAGDSFVFPAGEPRLTSWAEATPARPAPFALEGRHPEAVAWIDAGWFVRRHGDVVEQLLRVSDYPLLGRHNQENAAAAIAATLPWNVDANAMAQALRTMQPLPHRTVLVLEHEGIRFVDDSKATNVHAAQASLRGLQGPFVLLLGGSGKGEDYTALREAMREVRCAICYGAEGPALARALAGATEVQLVTGLESAVDEALAHARAGDTVLLSPACASFDEFTGYDQRGDRFAGWVREKVERR